jgi:hypothetical protein
MNVLTIRQGDGIYVRDYMKSASLDFLRMLFSATRKKPDDEWLVDPIHPGRDLELLGFLLTGNA